MQLVAVKRLNPEYDEPEICERCGAPIANAYVVDDGEEEHVFGSTCIRTILPKTPRWFELWVEAKALGIIDYFGSEASTSLTTRDLHALIEYVSA